MEYLIIFILFAAVIFVAGKYYGLKKQLKAVCAQLRDEANSLVTVAFIDSDMEAVASEINRLLEKIRRTIIKSNASSAALKSSIADISHDMKTPLTSVIGYLQLAERECNDEKTKELLKICLERAHYCNSLINDFFELSVFETQGCIPRLENVDVAGMICEQILAHYPIFEGKRITPYFQDSDKPVMAFADVRLLNRVIQNLISNGIKNTSGDIFFHLFQKNEHVSIVVSNSIHNHVDVAHIFDRFYTTDRPGNKGSGIGLYLCRQLIEAMGGSISAEVNGKILSIKVTLHSA
ncbi:MAG: HAMP domain-containing histidine kinase [Lachnospiraceae bacterium]|nr:HAMP domain-containing histidine kinase [Lachnospiraceae bacterium]MCM1239527.1 HAMP domain-containing histidine kinase [Lachnospiraceae bacterium]